MLQVDVADLHVGGVAVTGLNFSGGELTGLYILDDDPSLIVGVEDVSRFVIVVLNHDINLPAKNLG